MGPPAPPPAPATPRTSAVVSVLRGAAVSAVTLADLVGIALNLGLVAPHLGVTQEDLVQQYGVVRQQHDTTLAAITQELSEALVPAESAEVSWVDPGGADATS